jgi:hypothetical protein
MSPVGTKRQFARYKAMSGVDAVDGSSTGTSVPWMWALLKAPTIQRSEPCRR